MLNKYKTASQQYKSPTCVCKTLLLTMQAAHFFTPLSPSWAALVDCVQIHVVHLPVCCVVCCPEKEMSCYSHMIAFSVVYCNVIYQHCMS